MEVLLVPKTTREIHVVDKVVDEVDVVVRDGCAEDVDDADVVVVVDHRESLPLTVECHKDTCDTTLPELKNQS